MRTVVKSLGVLLIMVLPSSRQPFQNQWIDSTEGADQGSAPTEKCHDPGLRAIDGRVNRVDPATRTFELIEERINRLVSWDEKTTILVAGHAVKPSAIVRGARLMACVQVVGEKWRASSIVISPESLKKTR